MPPCRLRSEGAASRHELRFISLLIHGLGPALSPWHHAVCCRRGLPRALNYDSYHFWSREGGRDPRQGTMPSAVKRDCLAPRTTVHIASDLGRRAGTLAMPPCRLRSEGAASRHELRFTSLLVQGGGPGPSPWHHAACGRRGLPRAMNYDSYHFWSMEEGRDPRHGTMPSAVGGACLAP